MANEITLPEVTVQYADTEGGDFDIVLAGFIKNLSSKIKQHAVVSVGFAAEEAIPLGEVSSLGLFIARNRDSTNFVSVRAGTGTENFVKLFPKDSDGNSCWCILFFGSGVTAPYWIADTAACQVEYWLFSN